MSDDQVTAICRMVAKQKPGLVRQLGPDDAEDAIQEVFLAAAGAIQAGSEIRDLEAYLHGIGRKKVINEIRRRQMGRRCLLSLSPSIPDPRLNPEQALIERERRQQARRAVERLPAAGREVLLRFYCREQSKDAVQAEMGLTPTRFRLLKSRALERARRYYRGSAIAA